MTFGEFRKQRGLTLEQCAVALDLQPTSKGFLSTLESGTAVWPLRLALQAERWSDGEIRALELLEGEEAELLRGAIDRARADRVGAPA